MNAQKLKAKRAERRRYRVRKKIYGTPERPRLSVYRSNLHIAAQLIDDLHGVTLAAASSVGKKFPAETGLKHGGNIAAARVVGQRLAEAAKAKGITQAAFDRGQYRFHGRVAALAIAASEAGLICTDPEKAKAKLTSGKRHAPPPAEAKAKGGERPRPEAKAKGKPEAKK